MVALLEDVELVIIDEISTVGAAQFEIMNRRLEQVGKVLWRRRFGTRPPDSLGGFGGLGVVLMGDFAQLPPVRSSTLMPGARLEAGRRSGLRALALAGRQTFARFEDVIRLRVIHRMQAADSYKESTIRLRDAAITCEDYDLWKTHEIESLTEPSAASWPGGEDLAQNGLCLVTDNAQAGRINGQRLADAAPLLSAAPVSDSATNVVARCEARHNNPRGERRKAADFRNVPKAAHLRVGAHVTLTLNAIWDVQTVPLGLMNGARGIVVAILYAAPGSKRIDESVMADSGYPSSDSASFPRGLEKCPLPDFVVVHFPGYIGPHMFPGLPATWVPIPATEVSPQNVRSLVRFGLPLRLAWAITIQMPGHYMHRGHSGFI